MRGSRSFCQEGEGASPTARIQELSYKFGPSWHGPKFMRAELVLGPVVRNYARSCQYECMIH